MLHLDRGSPRLAEIVPDDAALDVIAHGLVFGEGPVWHAAEGALYWNDILGDTTWRWKPGVGRELVMRPSGKANGMTFDLERRRVVAGWASRSVWRVEHDGSIVVLADQHENVTINTPNDIVVRSDGSIYWTDSSGALFIPGMDGLDVQRYLDFEGVFQIRPDGTVVLATSAVTYPNGLAFSPDESLLYVTDTVRRCVWRFDVAADGGLSEGSIFYELVGDEPGVADGMKVDVEGNLYVTGTGGIHLLDTSGRLLGRIRVPGPHTSNMAWGGEDWRTLFITTHEFVYRTRLSIPGIAVAPLTREA